MITARRDDTFDVLKGFAIFLVVMGHVLLFSLQGMKESVPMQFIANFHMPLFFFISGWFSWRLTDSGKLRYPLLGKRLRQLVLPTIVVSTLFLFYHDHSGVWSDQASLRTLWMSESKMGYWFTLSLFEMFVLMVPLVRVLRCCTTLAVRSVLCLMSWLLPYTVLVWLSFMADKQPAGIWGQCDLIANGLLQLRATFTYLPPFLFGLMASSVAPRFYKLISDNRIMTLVVVLIVPLFLFVCNADSFHGAIRHLNKPAIPLLHILFAILAMAVVRPWCVCTDQTAEPAIAPERGIFKQMWVYIGRRSLGIYLLHYFFIFPLKPLQSLVDGMAPGFVPLVLISATAAATIVAAVLAFIRILRPSGTLSRLLTGREVAN